VNAEGHTPSAQASRLEQVGRKLAANSAAGMVTQALHLASRIAVTPYVLAYIPLREYGLWTICFVIISYAGISAFGINNVFVKYVAEYQSRDDIDSISRLMTTGLTALTCLCAAMFAVLYFGLPWFMTRHGVDPAFGSMAGALILGSAAIFLFDIVMGAFRGMLEGMQEIALMSFLSLAAVVLEVALIFILLPAGMGVYGMLAAYAAKTVLLNVVLAALCYKRLSGLRISPAFFDKSCLRLFVVFGGKVQALGFMGIFIETFDRVVAGSMLGLEAAGLIEIGRKFPNTARGFSGAAFGPFLPAAAYLGGWWEGGVWPTAGQKLQKYLRIGGLALVFGLALVAIPLALVEGGVSLPSLPAITARPTLVTAAVLLAWLALAGWLGRYVNKDERFVGEGVRRVFLFGSRHINLINVTVFCFLVAVSDRLILAWVGAGYEQATAILVIVGVSNMIHQSTGPGTYVFRGIDRVGLEFEYMLVQFVLCVVWIPAMTAMHGVLGAAAGFSCAAVAASLYFFRRAFKALGIPLGEALRVTALPCLAPVAAASLVRLAVILIPTGTRWSMALQIVVLGLAHVAVTLWMLHRWFLSREEWEAVSAQLGKLASRLGFSGRAA
jgi:O-antigen/teichoic acid export membrane protein